MSAAPDMRAIHQRFVQTFSNDAAAKAFIAFYLTQWPPSSFGTICITYPKPDGRMTVRCLRAG